MSVVLDGPVAFRRHDDGRVEVLQAPARARITLGLLVGADAHLVRADGNTVTFAGQVTYRVTGWDPLGSALLAELYEDRRARRG